ncbi:RNA-directed DNA polymerase (Reverse transcriptase) [Plantactinospora sp. CA-290183]|uniref:RNA-directed DNA polymerase (Reverse transcriptase) n=1 Tax=Plantactinospora sp. CA-290183 TaxID=3240006 RepID=UPI003D8DF35C
MSHPASHTLMPLIADPRRLKQVARALMRRPTTPGADQITWAEYRRGLDNRLNTLAERLHAGQWRPGLTQVRSWPSWGKTMTICVPTVEDRVVHRAIRTAVEPVLDQDAYPPWLYGWRPRAGRLHAVAAAARHLNTGRTAVADLDVAAATVGATSSELIDQLARWVHDGAVLTLVRRILDALPTPLAPGGGLTPMLTNLRLIPVDEQLTQLTLIRVTDNYTAFCCSWPEAEAAASRISAALAARGLRANPTKSKVWHPNPEDLYLAG